MHTTLQMLPDGAWLDRLDPAFLAATYPSWAAGATTFEAAVDAFRRHGFATFATIGEGLTFEAAYFREVNPAWEGVDDLASYREWLVNGLAAGGFGSARGHLRGLGLELAAYPAAFPWRYYARLRPHAGAHRWSALDDFCSSGFADLGDRFAYGPNAGDLLCALGRKFSVNNDMLAVRAYELAQSRGSLPPTERQHLADAYLRLGLWRPAMLAYGAIVRDGDATCWTVRNFIRCAEKLELWQDMRACLDQTCRSLGTDALWAATVGEAIAGLFENPAQAARALMAEGAYTEADALLSEMVEGLAPRAERWLFRPADDPANAAGKVVILVNEDDPESAQRGALQMSRLLDARGVPSEIHPFTQPDRYPPLAPGIAAVVLFRVPALPPVIHYVLSARRLGVPTCYASDAALPDADTAASFESFRGRISHALYDDLRFGIPLHRAAARLCDTGIAPTERLAAALRLLVRTQRCCVVPNTLLPAPDPDTPAPAGVNRRLRLFLRVGSLTYVEAGPGTIGHGLLTYLERRPEAELWLSGPVHLDRRFDGLHDRLAHRGYGAAPWAYLNDLATADVNLAIGGASPEEEYRAELSWSEAAALAIPSVVAMPDGWLPIAREEVNALRAPTAEACVAALDRMLLDPAMRARLGTQAQHDVALHADQTAAATALHRLLSEPTPARRDHAG